MKVARITLAVTQGFLAGKEFVFEEQARWIIGRADDCDIQMPTDLAHLDVSRHHCELRIDPPNIEVRDLGSRNGTYINGENIGQRPKHQTPEDVDLKTLPARELHEGDMVQVGLCVLEVKERALQEC